MTDYVIHGAELDRLLTSPSGPVVLDLIRRGQRVLNAARVGCPVDTGRARASLSAELMRDSQGVFMRIGSNLEYVRYVHDGHGVILPRNGRFLRFPATNNSGSGNRRYVGGATARYVYARSVRAVEGRPFLRDALVAAAG